MLVHEQYDIIYISGLQNINFCVIFISEIKLKEFIQKLKIHKTLFIWILHHVIKKSMLSDLISLSLGTDHLLSIEACTLP